MPLIKLFWKKLLLLHLLFCSVAAGGHLAKLHNEITYRMINSVLDEKLSYYPDSGGIDGVDAIRLKGIFQVTQKMRIALIRELKYLPSEVDEMNPQVAGNVVVVHSNIDEILMY